MLNVISSSEDGWWKFLSSSSTVNFDRVEYDKNLLKQFYLNEGFYDVQITSVDLERKTNQEVNIIFSINSGKKYTFGNFNVIDENSEINEKNLLKIQNIINKKVKGFFSKKKLSNLADEIQNLFNIEKIEFVNLKIQEKKKDDNIINIDFVIRKSPRKYINIIEIKGNSITEEKVIRRNLLFAEGDALSEYKLDKSLQKLNNTGIFKDVQIQKDELDNKELLNLIIKVEEKPTGSISAGVGAGSDGAAVTTGVQEENLFGLGIKTNTNLSIGTEKISGNFTVILPDFLNSENILGYNLYLTETDFTNTGYKSNVVGNDIYTNYEIYDDVYFKIGTGLDLDKIETSESASNSYKSREGDYLTLKGFYNLVSDKRDRRFQPTRGYRNSFGQTFSIPPSEIPYIENKLTTSYYFPFSKEYIFNLKGGVSSINSLNEKDIKLSDRKFLSKSFLRGFESFGVGPIDGSEHIGGNYTAYSSISSTFPNFLPEKWNANSFLFFDVGNVWGVDYDETNDSNELRSSTGVTFEWISPLGPITFTYAEVISKDNTDVEENFSFQIGSTF